jgi:hypothetical protein
MNVENPFPPIISLDTVSSRFVSTAGRQPMNTPLPLILCRLLDMFDRVNVHRSLGRLKL